MPEPAVTLPFSATFAEARAANDVAALERWLDRPVAFRWTTDNVEALRQFEIRDRVRQLRGRRKKNR